MKTDDSDLHHSISLTVSLSHFDATKHSAEERPQATKQQRQLGLLHRPLIDKQFWVKVGFTTAVIWLNKLSGKVHVN